jgi:hypothetical protein
MYMSTYYIQNILPKKCAFDYAKMCTTNDKINSDTTCNNVNDLIKH